MARLTEGQPNLVVFALESLVKKEREKRDPGDGSLYLELEEKKPKSYYISSYREVERCPDKIPS